MVPDGTRIAYDLRQFEIDTYSIWVMNADGTQIVQLTHGEPSGVWPSWSPDGMQIAFAGYSEGFDIYVMDADGENLKKVTRGDKEDRYPTWTPDGTILFRRGPNSGPSDVFEVQPDGTGLARLTTERHVGNYYALSPDGAKIAIFDIEQNRIEILPLGESGPPQTIVEDVDLTCAEVIALAWSPDGQAITFACCDSGTYSGSDLYIVNTDGTGLRIIPNTGEALDPAWRPT